jgi:hypothetical protein
MVSDGEFGVVSMSFAVRMGFEVQNPLGLEEMSEKLSTSLWNILFSYFFGYDHMIRTGRLKEQISYQELSSKIFSILWTECMHRKVNKIAGPATYKLLELEEYWESCQPYQKYGIIEFLASLEYPSKKNYIEECNDCLKKMGSPYQFADVLLVQITNELELTEVGQALHHPKAPVQEHMKQAVQLFSDRENPDYRNAVKEAILAVGTICRDQTNEKDLRKALDKMINKGVVINNQLKEAFQKLYDYTNGPDGIRHELLENAQTVGFEEAKFMIVACSAFVNYITAKQAAMAPKHPR